MSPSRPDRPRVVVIGAGAAGLMAAAEAAKRSADVTLIEKNNKLGVKILMSGGTRCNLTQNTDARGIAGQFGHAERFLQRSIGAFSPGDVVKLFEDAGVATKVAPSGKVFPVSDRAIDVRDALVRRATEAGVVIRSGTAVGGIGRLNDAWCVQTDDATVQADRIIVTTGGKSYPGCGTTGDAYGWLEDIGHTILTPRPALVPLVGGTSWMHELTGIVVDECEATVRRAGGGKKNTLCRRRGSWLFTHFGFSGPAAMDISGTITAAEATKDLNVSLDMIPSLTQAEVERALSDRGTNGGRHQVSSVLANWLPNRLATCLAQQGGGDDTVAELPKKRLVRLVEQVKRMPITVTGTRGFAKAEVTAGGVQLGEVDPRTMESRKAKGLFIAGELLDVDGPIGGYNFQAAFSTGRAAGIAASG